MNVLCFKELLQGVWGMQLEWNTGRRKKKWCWWNEELGELTQKNREVYGRLFQNALENMKKAEERGNYATKQAIKVQKRKFKEEWGKRLQKTWGRIRSFRGKYIVSEKLIIKFISWWGTGIVNYWIVNRRWGVWGKHISKILFWKMMRKKMNTMRRRVRYEKGVVLKK